MSKHKLATILVVGILIRVILIPISSHPFDVYAWYQISNNIVENGPFTLQNFPPLWYHYMMVPIAYIYNGLSNLVPGTAIPMSSIPSALNFYPAYNIQYVPGWLFNSVVKTPFLISDILVTILLYKIVKQLTDRKGLAETAALLWFLNPFVIWISAGWGMWDTLPALFSLAAFYFILNKKIALSGVFIALGFACKLYPALFVIPIVAYLLKTSETTQKRKETLTFLAAFFAVSLMLFLPYLGSIQSFFTSFFLPAQQTSTFDPISNPVGFGLTYWSLSLLDRFFISVITPQTTSTLSIVSLALTVVFVLVAYLKVTKMNVKKPDSTLVLMMALPVFALFLGYRIVCEQFFVWLIPFLIILCVKGRIKPILFWAASLVALLYATLNCPLPFFFLPLAPWYSGTLVNMANFSLSYEPLRISLLAALGTLFSILLIVMLLQAFTKKDAAPLSPRKTEKINMPSA